MVECLAKSYLTNTHNTERTLDSGMLCATQLSLAKTFESMYET